MQPLDHIVIRSLVLAGQGTTAGTALWALYELSRRPELQERIRSEIEEARRSSGELNYDTLPMLNAVLKVCFRYLDGLFLLRRMYRF